MKYRCSECGNVVDKCNIKCSRCGNLINLKDIIIEIDDQLNFTGGK
jgi:predicted ATP-dependent serine protease